MWHWYYVSSQISITTERDISICGNLVNFQKDILNQWGK